MSVGQTFSFPLMEGTSHRRDAIGNGSHKRKNYIFPPSFL